MTTKRSIAVIGLGYVGLPVAVAFARAGFTVVGYDIDDNRISELRAGRDQTREVEGDELKNEFLTFSRDPNQLGEANFYIVTVPTPIDASNHPNLNAMIAASRTVAASLKVNDIVVYESTVYPGAIEEECIPILEKHSGLKSKDQFSVGYSPERINPGDKLHRFENITKIVSAQTAEALEEVASVYGTVVTAGIHRAPSIKVAEAAKVIENTQRDLNIAFMNELSLIFQRLNIDTSDVLAAANTKWNFLPFQPGLVGGHCIGVDPYYLTFRAEIAGYHPEVILAGRRINDGMGRGVGQACVRSLLHRNGRTGIVTILGFTFKENVPDTRNSRVVDIALELQSFGFEVQIADPLADVNEVIREYGVALTNLEDLQPANAVILAVAHDFYVEKGWLLIKQLLIDGEGLVFDVKSRLDRATMPTAIDLWRL